MKNYYNETVQALKNAKNALDVLKEFHEEQISEQQKNMISQVLEYISQKLINSNFMCKSFSSRHLSLSKMNNSFIFYIHSIGTNTGYPIFAINTTGGIRIFRDLDEWMILTLIEEWEDFKKVFSENIIEKMDEERKNINLELEHIGYINSQLKKWHI